MFQETRVIGVVEVGLEEKSDERGFFARTWCETEFAAHGLNSRLVQCNLSGNTCKGTLRGMHYQTDPHGEAKLIRCIKGRIFDVALDLRPESQTFLKWFGTELSTTNRRALYIPEGCAHGFLTLEDETEIYYQMSAYYHAESARGVRWDDPSFNIEWPAAAEVISERDRTYPDFELK